jgi:thioredoxin reductase (NADPH)
MESMRKQAEHFGTEFRTTDVTKVDLSTRPFRVTASDDDGITEARSLIIASGAGARLLGLPVRQESE